MERKETSMKTCVFTPEAVLGRQTPRQCRAQRTTHGWQAPPDTPPVPAPPPALVESLRHTPLSQPPYQYSTAHAMVASHPWHGFMHQCVGLRQGPWAAHLLSPHVMADAGCDWYAGSHHGKVESQRRESAKSHAPWYS